jgi:hypothetical protein
MAAWLQMARLPFLQGLKIFFIRPQRLLDC